MPLHMAGPRTRGLGGTELRGNPGQGQGRALPPPTLTVQPLRPSRSTTLTQPRGPQGSGAPAGHLRLRACPRKSQGLLHLCSGLRGGVLSPCGKLCADEGRRSFKNSPKPRVYTTSGRPKCENRRSGRLRSREGPSHTGPGEVGVHTETQSLRGTQHLYCSPRASSGLLRGSQGLCSRPCLSPQPGPPSATSRQPAGSFPKGLGHLKS